MARFEVNFSDEIAAQNRNVPEFGDYRTPVRKSKVKKILKITAIALVSILIIGAIGGFFYWQHLKTTPQYSLALLIDAARRDDQKTIDELVDIDAVVDDFLPQITDKAVELYGRGLSSATIAKVARVALPVLPAIKERAKAEIPQIIRDKTKRFEDVPFWAIALGANQFVDITVEGDTAFVQSNVENRPLKLTMKKNGDRWQVVGIEDEEIARRIAETVGQEIIAIASGKSTSNGKSIGVDNLPDVIKKAEDILK